MARGHLVRHIRPLEVLPGINNSVSIYTGNLRQLEAGRRGSDWKL